MKETADKTIGRVRPPIANDLDRELLRHHPLRGELSPKGGPVCASCAGIGYHFDPLGGGPMSGAFVLCECQRKVCRCGHRPPYDYYDAQTNAMAHCPARRAEMAVDRCHSLLKRSAIPERYKWKFISSLEHVDASTAIAVDHAIETVRRFSEYRNQTSNGGEAQGLYLHGPTGCGKTLLSCAILNELIRLHQIPVLYAKISRDILGQLRASFNPNSDYYGEGRKIEERLANVTALVMDDFGAHRETEFVNSVLYDLIDARYEKKLPTIITSNEPLEKLRETGGGRLYSRLKEMCVEIHLEAPDYRLRGSRSY